MNWPFYKQKWKFVPTPNQETGHIKPNEWLSWTGNTYDPVTFDLKGAFLLDKIEATGEKWEGGERERRVEGS